MRLVLTVVVCITSCLAASDALGRKWTDKTGKFSIEAEYVRTEGGKVVLRRADGKVMRVDLDKLSESDKRYVDSKGSSPPDVETVAPGSVELSLVLTTKPAGRLGSFALSGRKRDPPLRAIIELQGQPATETSASGLIKLQTAKYAGGQRMQKAKNVIQMFDATSRLIPAKGPYSSAFRSGKKTQSLKLEIAFEPPPSRVQKVAILRGTLQLLTGGKEETVTIDQITSLIGKRVVHSTLDKSDVKLAIARKPPGVSLANAATSSSESVTVEIRGTDANVLNLWLADGNGDRMSTNISRYDGKDVVSWTLAPTNRRLPKDAKLQLTVVVGARRVLVPFEFENQPIKAQ